MSFEELFNSQQRPIKQVIAFTIRRHRLNQADAEEFTSRVYLKLVEKDYEILRKFREESSLRTYLTVVINNLSLDFLTEKFGKFRPSAEAKRRGRHAVLLEQLTIRDGYSFDEACELIRTNHGLNASDEEFERLRAVLPARQPRQHVDDRELETMPAVEDDAEAKAMLSEAQAKAARFWKVFDGLLEALPAQDRLMIEMQFDQGLTLAQISRMLHIEQARLYRHRHEVFAALKARLEEEGFSGSEIHTYLASPRPPAEED